MKIVVTGATGNVGTSTLRSLVRDERVDEVIGLARRRPNFDMDKMRFVRADITTDDLVPVFQGADAVIHLAWVLQPARDPEKLHRVNVEGSKRVFQAVARAGVPALVYASSVGAYAAGPKDRHVDEGWPTDGIATSLYSRQKVAVERELDALEREHPDLRVVRMRPGLIFKRGAAAEIRRLFLGPLVPSFLFRKDRIPVVPDLERLRFQCVHSHDIGDAYTLAAVHDVHGPFNLAAEPVLDPAVLSETLHARRLRMPEGLLRHGAQAAWRLHMIPAHRGWVDLALGVPLMSTQRARVELGWRPTHSATETLLELLGGLHDGSGMATQPLHP